MTTAEKISIALPPEMVTIVRSAVATGEYANYRINVASNPTARVLCEANGVSSGPNCSHPARGTCPDNEA